MDQPIPVISEEDIFRIVERDFGKNKRELVLNILSQYGIEKYEAEALRVRIAILKNANGDIEELKTQLSIAKNDYRDVLMHAEYPICAKNLFLDKYKDKEKIQKTYREDWANYQEWLNKK